MEKFFLAMARGNLLSNREHWALSIFARFDASASQEHTESALRHAWKTLRHDHPQLACTMRGENMDYEVPGQPALDAWLDETFFVVPATTNKEDLLASFRPTAFATLHYLPHTSEIILHTSHWRTDFVGGISLLHNLFSALAEPRKILFGDEGTRLSPGRDEAADFGPSDEKAKEAATELFMRLATNMPSIGLPAQNLDQTPGGTRRSELVLDISATAAIISGSKKRGFTVTTAVHTALIAVLQQLSSCHAPSSRKYTTFGIFNIRPLLRPPFNDSFTHPAGVQILGLPLVLQPSTYDDLATQLKEYYKQRVPPSKDSNIEQAVIVPYTNMTAETAGQPPLPAPREPVLSSMGVLDRYLQRSYGKVVVKEFWVGIEMMTPQLACHLWTWQGRMTLAACYNETFYVDSFVQDFLRRVIDIVKMELAI